ncbi:MAG: GspH/FimT family pseudopilin [Phycisphaeraceae bacterium]
MRHVPKPRQSESFPGASATSGSWHIAHHTSHIAFRAFTLIELILVLMLITLTLAMTAPSFRGWSRGGKLRDAADQFQAATLHAQSQSAAQALTYRLQIASDGKSYQLTPLASDSTSDASASQTFTLPDHLTIQLLHVTGGDGSSIRFSPTGSTTPAQVRIAADWGDSIILACNSAIAVFTRVKEP